MLHKHFRGVLAFILSLIIIASPGFCASVSGGDKCLVLHSTIVEGQTLDSPRAGIRMTQDFCLSEKYNDAELTGRAMTGRECKTGWGMSTTIIHPDPKRIPREKSCEAIWSIDITGDNSDNPGKYALTGVVNVLEFESNRSILSGQEYYFELSIELDKEFLIPIGPIGEFENVSLAAKLTIDSSEDSSE